MLSRIRNQLNAEIRKVKKDEVGCKEELDEKLEKERQKAVKEAVAKQSSVIKRRLKDEFDDRLRDEIRIKQAEFDKKEANLDLLIERRAEKLFR